MKNLTIENQSWPLLPWTAEKHTAAVLFVQLRWRATNRPEEDAYARVKNLPEHLQTIGFARYIDRYDTPLPNREQAERLLVECETVRYMARLVCPSCPTEAITPANALEVYCQLFPTPPTAEERQAEYDAIQSLLVPIPNS